MNDNYTCGINNEKKVKAKLKRMGASTVKLSPGSRGGFDVLAMFPSGRKLAVQVKSTCEPEGRIKNLSKKQAKRLDKDARNVNATPVVAKVRKGQIVLNYLSTGIKVK